MTKVPKSIAAIIQNRMDARLKNLYSTIAILLSYGHTGYYVAGNSCNADNPHDYDIYPDYGGTFDLDDIASRVESLKGYVACKTRNALTVNMSGKILQFCNYSKPDLTTLLSSFDFAHIQVGIHVEIEWEPGDHEDGGGYGSSYITAVKYTPEWELAHLAQTTWYTGSDYPLSSLLRTTKYFQRGAYAKKHEYKKDILNILNDIISRGYKDYQDYKDQLAAIDLLLLEPEEKKAAWNLWKTCCDRGLVEHFDPDWEINADSPEEDYEGDKVKCGDYVMQRVNRKMTSIEMLNVPFEHRAELFKNSVELAKKKFMIDMTADYLNSCDVYHIVLTDRVDANNQVYYNTLTKEED